MKEVRKVNGQVHSLRGLAEALGRAGAAARNDDQREGVALALHYLVGELAMQDWGFDAEEFRAEADEKYDMWVEQARKDHEAGVVLAKMAKHVWQEEREQ